MLFLSEYQIFFFDNFDSKTFRNQTVLKKFHCILNFLAKNFKNKLWIGGPEVWALIPLVKCPLQTANFPFFRHSFLFSEKFSNFVCFFVFNLSMQGYFTHWNLRLSTAFKSRIFYNQFVKHVSPNTKEHLSVVVILLVFKTHNKKIQWSATLIA